MPSLGNLSPTSVSGEGGRGGEFFNLTDTLGETGGNSGKLWETGGTLKET